MKIWNVARSISKIMDMSASDIIDALLDNRGIKEKKERDFFLNPPNPHIFTPNDVGIDEKNLAKVLERIKKAYSLKESVVIYSDYDADGITGGAILWETLHILGFQVMPYVPHRQDEGYGLSEKGIEAVRQQYNATLIITVDHGISGANYVTYAKKIGIDVIVTDHHLPPETLPDCPIVHTTSLCGAGVAWMVASFLRRIFGKELLSDDFLEDLLALASIGTIADMVPLVGPNRSIAKYGLFSLRKTKRVGLQALMDDAGVIKERVTTYEVSHVLTPRLNALGRLEHAMDALRLLCTKNSSRGVTIAKNLGLTNKERQKLTTDMSLHAKNEVLRLYGEKIEKKLLLVKDVSYNQGVIGLVAGKLVESYYRPAIVIAEGQEFSKASARSIAGFNIIEAIRSFSDLLVDMGGHPLAAGFTIETKNISLFQKKLEDFAESNISESMLTKPLYIDIEMPLSLINETLWEALRVLEPFGMGNYEPVFATYGLHVLEAKKIGSEGKHLKLKVTDDTHHVFEAVAFAMGDMHKELKHDVSIAIAYTIDMNEWNGRRNLQLKIRDINL